jgi:hypothetical protein
VKLVPPSVLERNAAGFPVPAVGTVDPVIQYQFTATTLTRMTIDQYWLSIVSTIRPLSEIWDWSTMVYDCPPVAVKPIMSTACAATVDTRVVGKNVAESDLYRNTSNVG